MCVCLNTDNKLTSMTKSMTISRVITQSASVSMTVSALLSLNTACVVLIFTIFIFIQFYFVTCLVLCLFNRPKCVRFSTQRHIGEGLIFLRRLLSQKRACSQHSLSTTVYIRKYIGISVSLLSSSKREFLLAGRLCI